MPRWKYCQQPEIILAEAPANPGLDYRLDACRASGATHTRFNVLYAIRSL